MTAFAPKPRTNSSLTSCGWISQYTFASRTRRAMSCVYCAPKSRIRMRSCPGASDALGLSALLDAVIGCFLRDLHVVHVRLADARAGDLDELRSQPQLVDGGAAGIAHARPHAARQLLDDPHH